VRSANARRPLYVFYPEIRFFNKYGNQMEEKPKQDGAEEEEISLEEERLAGDYHPTTVPAAGRARRIVRTIVNVGARGLRVHDC
jgi:hypothetical protein